MEIARINNKPVELTEIIFNESVFYAIKAYTGDSENDIISYFYELGIQVFNNIFSKKKMPARCYRSINIFYKDSNIFVKLEVSSTYFNSPFTKKISLRMNISYPKDFISINGSHFIQGMLENNLGLTDNQLVKARKPMPKIYKSMVKNIKI